MDIEVPEHVDLSNWIQGECFIDTVRDGCRQLGYSSGSREKDRKIKVLASDIVLKDLLD